MNALLGSVDFGPSPAEPTKRLIAYQLLTSEA